MSAVTVLQLNNAALDCNHIAEIATSLSPTSTDRLGQSKLTLNGALESLGYQVPVAYTTGISLTSGTQTVEYNSVVYAPLLSQLPFTTSGTFETSKFRPVQGTDTIVSTVADLAALPVPQLAAGRTLTVLVLGKYAADDGGGDPFYWQYNSNETHDGAWVVQPNSLPSVGRWKRARSGEVHTKMYAYGDDSHDDTTALNSAAAKAIAKSWKFVIDPGTYKISSNLLIGKSDGSRINGFTVEGAGHNCAAFKWYGGNTGTAVTVKGILQGKISGFRVVASDNSNKPSIGLRYDGGTNSGGQCLFQQIAIGNCATGLKIGGSTQSLAAVPGTVWQQVLITDCTAANIDIEGSDSDGQLFYGLFTANAPKVFNIQYGRNIGIYGGVHSNPTGTGTGYSNFVYMHAENVLGGGAYRISDIRCEGGVGVLHVGIESGDPSESEFDCIVENFVNASIHADIAATYNICYMHHSGSIAFRNCYFPALGGKFSFANNARTNRHNKLVVEGCGLGYDRNIDTFGDLVDISGNGGGGSTGGLTAYFRANYKISAPTGSPPQVSWADNGLPIPDRNIRVTPDAADGVGNGGTPYFIYFDQSNPDGVFHDPANGRMGIGGRPTDAHKLQVTNSSSEFLKLTRGSDSFEVILSAVDSDTRDVIVRPTTNSCGVSIFGKSSGGTLRGLLVDKNGKIRPTTDNTQDLGDGTHRYGTVYAGTGTINTSDENEKCDIQRIDPRVLKAWGKLEFCQFRFKDAVEKKGADARIHFGGIAQRVYEAFASEGLDPFAYGLLCKDAWEFQAAVYDEDGSLLSPEMPAGERWGIRYDEALALECAYLRSRLN